ncbi:MAG: efflux RND transporter permease subunit [Caldimicrobium sp.]|nr:efflux RND transporter permease subunit [Caldimicrobium sp.]MCX7613573.1 efflux RND transporter permease subunit [Caldimicrobium sp.]MDW8182333.1 efflux RND transporter permease subunit [Caldimicrobium sp.]
MDRSGFIVRIVSYFLESKLTPILIIVTLALGLFAIVKTPKEEEPQIVVPMIDIILQYPGAEPEEVEKRVVTPLEKKLWELKDIEYIYSVSKPGMAVITARFYVGTDPVKALVELNSKWMSALDLAPPGVILPPLIKPKSIDDVPILSLTLWGKHYDSYDLRRMAALLENEIKKLDRVAEVTVIGGRPREIRVILDPARLQSYALSPLSLAQILKSANAQCVSGRLKDPTREYILQTGEFLRSKSDIENIVVAIRQGKPVYLRDVAKIVDGPSEIKDYVFIGFGPSSKEISQSDKGSELYPAVTLAVSKRKGTNAVKVAEEVLDLVSKVRAKYLPKDLHLTVTRNYGETAREKTNELLEHLFIATFSVTLLIAVALGWREALVVGIAVPITLSIALFLNMLYGFTLNRVTLFALIFCIGILVDDPIVGVENIHRWFRSSTISDPKRAIIGAINEVMAPIILATFTVIAALLPMAFVTGLMGPYMRPIPINASVAMFFSLLVSITVTPWASYRFLKVNSHKKFNSHGTDTLPEEVKQVQGSTLYKFYSRLMEPFLFSPKRRFILYAVIVALLLATFSLFYFKIVLVKMLPYDNKSEVQIVLDMPEGTPLERTLEAAKAIGDYIKRENLVTDYQIYVGTNSPFNFNGLVRHYYLRNEPHLADIQINLVSKYYRKEQSHDFAKRIRPEVHKIARSYGAKYVAVVEVPPGPPVLSTIVAEVYAPELKTQENFSRKLLELFKESELITDEGIYLEDPTPRIRLIAKEDKLKLAGLTKEELVQIIKALCQGLKVDTYYSTDTEEVPIVLQMDEKFRTVEWLRNFKVTNEEGSLIPLSELVEIKEDRQPTSIYHKNLRRVTYVIGDTGGPFEAPVYAIFDVGDDIKKLTHVFGSLDVYWLNHPTFVDRLSIKWDGEMHITLEVFRDLGIAFLGAIFVMYVLILIWFKDFRIPGVIMAPIPLTLFGIIPGHLIMNSFFTATSMIGFIALAGIIVRNSIIVVDFAEQRIRMGLPLHLAVIESATVRTRPILLTAIGVIVGALVILFDPIFNGLAISLIFGTLGSTLLSLFLIPLLYYGHKIKERSSR